MSIAWAPIHVAEAHEDGKNIKRRIIKAGEEVNKGDLTDADWRQLHEEGVLRRQPFPKGVKQGESVRTALIRQANEARDAALSSVPTIIEPDEDDEPANTGGSKKPWER